MEHWLESRAISFSEFFFSSLLQRSFLEKGGFGGFCEQDIYKRKAINFSGYWIVFSSYITRASICHA